MRPHVKDLRDLSKLFTPEGEHDVPKIFKRTPARLDTIVQAIWHYQQFNPGLTPKARLLETEVGLPSGGFAHYRNLLESDGRISVISHRPLRVTLKYSHPKNKAAIARKQRELEKIGQAPRQIAPKLPFEKGCPEVAPEINNEVIVAASSYVEALDAVAIAKAELKNKMPRLLLTAETRDLISELVERGYVISKGR